MTTKTTYLISCLVLLANCNVYAICPQNCEDSIPGSTGYFASGSAHSSQYVLPSGEVVTHSKGSSFSSDGIKKTFHQLKQEADQFVSKQKDTVNIPNALPPLHSSFGQDLLSLQSLGQVGYPAQGYYGVGSQNLQGQTGYSSQGYSSTGAGSHNSQVYYQTIPQASHVVSTKKQQIQVNKKIVTHGSDSYGAGGSGSDVEEIETNQNVLDSNLNGDSSIYKPLPSYISSVNVESGKTREEIETLGTKPVVVRTPGQTSFSQYERIQKHNSSSHLIPGLQTYIPTGQFTTGIIGLGDTENVNTVKNSQKDLTTFVTNKTPSKISSAATENHYVHNENTGSFNYEKVGSKVESEVNNQQEEHKYEAVPPVISGSELPIKIKYVYDGKTVKKIEIYSSGASQNIPITFEEQDNVLKEMRKQSSYVSQSQHNVQPVSHEKPESDGYSYPPKDQTFLYPSNVQTFKKEHSQSSHSQQTITDGTVHQLPHLPLNVNSQKQHYTQSGYAGVLPPSSQVKYEGSEQSADAFNHLQNNPAILVGGVPQLIPVQNQHSSSSSGSTFHSSSYSGGTSGGFVFPADSLASSQTSSDLFEKLSSLNSGSTLLNCGDCLTNIGTSASGVPIKNSYGVSTSFSSSSSNINGKKTENRHASVSVNDNGKVDTYNVKS